MPCGRVWVPRGEGMKFLIDNAKDHFVFPDLVIKRIGDNLTGKNV